MASLCFSVTKNRRIRAALFFIMGGLIVSIAYLFARNYFIDLVQYRVLPLIVLIGGIIFLKDTIRQPDFKGSLALLTLHAISAVLISRVLYNTVPHRYGFYLLPLSLICCYFTE